MHHHSVVFCWWIIGRVPHTLGFVTCRCESWQCKVWPFHAIIVPLKGYSAPPTGVLQTPQIVHMTLGNNIPLFVFPRGRFGQVHKCVENSSGLTFAAKIIKAKTAKEKVYILTLKDHFTTFRILMFMIKYHCFSSLVYVSWVVGSSETKHPK